MRYVRVPMNLAKLYGPYVLKPMLWPEIGRQLRAIRQRVDKSDAPAATAWCAERALDEDAALGALGARRQDPGALFSEVFEAATRRVRAVPSPLGGAAHLSLVYSLCEKSQARVVIESGVAYGWSSLVLLLSLKQRNGRLYSVDLPYFKHRNDRWVGCAVPKALWPNWRLYQMADREGLPKALAAAGPVDLVHYDSDKTAEGRAFAYPRLWQALRPGGFFVTDDIGDNFAFRDFASASALEPLVVAGQRSYVGILVKPGSP